MSRLRMREGDVFVHSLTDLMSGLAVIFLLVAVLFIVLTAQAQRQVKAKARQFEEISKLNNDSLDFVAKLQAGLEKVFAQEVTDNVVQVMRDPRDPFLIIVLFNSEASSGGLRFERGRSELLPETKRFIETRFPALLEEICQKESMAQIESLMLEGHTDTQKYLVMLPDGSTGPAKDSFEKNVELSARRAQQVFFHTRLQLLAGPAVGLATCLDKRFVVAGRGSMDPFVQPGNEPVKDGEEDPPSRRVVLKIKVKSGSAELGR